MSFVSELVQHALDVGDLDWSFKWLRPAAVAVVIASAVLFPAATRSGIEGWVRQTGCGLDREIASVYSGSELGELRVVTGPDGCTVRATSPLAPRAR